MQSGLSGDDEFKLRHYPIVAGLDPAYPICTSPEAMEAMTSAPLSNFRQSIEAPEAFS